MSKEKNKVNVSFTLTTALYPDIISAALLK
jgi:hypothetical protein